MLSRGSLDSPEHGHGTSPVSSPPQDRPTAFWTVRHVLVLALTSLLLLTGAWLLVGYPIYHFPDPMPFSGPRFLNPYAGPGGRWLKANFHAHSIAWWGLTNGKTSEGDLVRAYADMGYDVIGLSNYWRVSSPDGRPAVYHAYEHGMNVGRSHHIVIGAHAVLPFDYPILQSINRKQFVLRLLRNPSEVLVIAHPGLDTGFSRAEMAKLTDYDAMEAVSGIAKSQGWWDAALSAGRLRWIIAGDDSHDAANPDRTGICWNMVRSASLAQADVLDALRNGRSYGVKGRGGRLGIALDRCEMRGDTLHVATAPEAAFITFTGQGGKVRRTVTSVAEADYTFQADDTYIRVEIVGPGTHLYLNPVVRTRDGHPDPARASVAWLESVAMWAAYAALSLVVLAIVWRGRLPRLRFADSRRVPAPTAEV
jgi:hypothetical protein